MPAQTPLVSRQPAPPRRDRPVTPRFVLHRTHCGSGRMSKATMRIALMSSQRDWGGGEQYLWSLGQGLIERGHRVRWVGPPQSVLRQRIDAANYDVFQLSGRKPTPVSLVKLRRQLQSDGTQILHANDSHALRRASGDTALRRRRASGDTALRRGRRSVKRLQAKAFRSCQSQQLSQP